MHKIQGFCWDQRGVFGNGTTEIENFRKVQTVFKSFKKGCDEQL